MSGDAWTSVALRGGNAHVVVAQKLKETR